MGIDGYVEIIATGAAIRVSAKSRLATFICDVPMEKNYVVKTGVANCSVYELTKYLQAYNTDSVVLPESFFTAGEPTLPTVNIPPVETFNVDGGALARALYQTSHWGRNATLLAKRDRLIVTSVGRGGVSVAIIDSGALPLAIVLTPEDMYAVMDMLNLLESVRAYAKIFITDVVHIVYGESCCILKLKKTVESSIDYGYDVISTPGIMGVSFKEMKKALKKVSIMEAVIAIETANTGLTMYKRGGKKFAEINWLSECENSNGHLKVGEYNAAHIKNALMAIEVCSDGVIHAGIDGGRLFLIGQDNGHILDPVF